MDYDTYMHVAREITAGCCQAHKPCSQHEFWLDGYEQGYEQSERDALELRGRVS